MLAREALGALALIGTRQVEAGATVLALAWNVTLVDICLTLLSREAGGAHAGELVGHRDTGTSVHTGVGQAGIRPLAQLPWSGDNRAQCHSWLGEGVEQGCGPVRCLTCHLCSSCSWVWNTISLSVYLGNSHLSWLHCSEVTTAGSSS